MFISYREIGVIYCLWNLKESLFSLFISTVVAHFLTVQLHLFNQFSCSCLRGPRWQWMVWNGGNGQPGVHVPASTACSEGGSCSSSLMQFSQGHGDEVRCKTLEGCHAQPKEVIGTTGIKEVLLLLGACLQEKVLPNKPTQQRIPLSCE